MTTIALKDGILASDTRASVRGAVMTDNFQKIFDVSDKEYTVCGKHVLAYALSGYVHSRLMLDSILQEGIQVGSTLDTDDDFSSIIVTDSVAYNVSKDEDNPNLRIIEIPPEVHWAIGSGASVANYVMYRGGDAVKSVIEACTVDPNSGGEVDVWQYPEYEQEEEANS
jgi:hypothetical protein